MGIETYDVVLDPSSDGTEIWAFIPALPGCVSVGSTKEEALQNVSQALQLMLDTIRETKKTLPTHYRVVVSKS